MVITTSRVKIPFRQSFPDVLLYIIRKEIYKRNRKLETKFTWSIICRVVIKWLVNSA